MVIYLIDCCFDGGGVLLLNADIPTSVTTSFACLLVIFLLEDCCPLLMTFS